MARPSKLIYQGPQRKIQIPYTPTPRQEKFHSCDASVVMYGGAAGGGKSKALLWEGFMQCLEHPGILVGLFRRSFPELEKSLILESLKYFPRSICKYNEVKHRWTIQTGSEQSYMDFCFALKETDVLNYKSAEFGMLGIDESTDMTKYQITFLMGRTRSSIPGVSPKVRLTTNPGGVSHHWHREYFGVGRVPKETVFTPQSSSDDLQPLSRCFIPARVTDNEHLMSNDPDYVKRLYLLPEQQRKMYLDGDWEQFVGQFFTEVKAHHYVKSFRIPADWKCYRAIDHGFSAPFCCLWIASSPDGHWYVYREMYASGLKPVEQAKMVREATHETIEYSVCDPAMKARHKGDTAPIEDWLSAADISLVPANNNRVHGWIRVRNFLMMHKDGTPILRIFEDKAPNLKRELEDAIYGNPTAADDLNSELSDHAIDALRYFCASRPEQTVESVKADGENDSDRPLAERREWKHVREMQSKIAGQRDDEAILAGLNREDEPDDSLGPRAAEGEEWGQWW